MQSFSAQRSCRTVAIALLSAFISGCAADIPPAKGPPRIGRWVWTREDAALFTETAVARPDLEAGVYIGSIHCDASSGLLEAHAGLSPSVTGAASITAVIRFEDGLDACRVVNDTAHRFNQSLDSAVGVLRKRGATTPVSAMQLDYDAPQRALDAWAGSVRYLTQHALAEDSVWLTSLIAQLREPKYGDLFRDVVRGHVLQVFDTGEFAEPEQVTEAVRVAGRARMPFRVGLGAFERRGRHGTTNHRAWFSTIPQFAKVPGYRGLWVFPAGERWATLLRETS